jgi:hypothetical protein
MRCVGGDESDTAGSDTRGIRTSTVGSDLGVKVDHVARGRQGGFSVILLLNGAALVLHVEPSEIGNVDTLALHQLPADDLGERVNDVVGRGGGHGRKSVEGTEGVARRDIDVKP